jgi:hypothetical protein
MAQQIILNGTVPNDGTGDSLWVTANKMNANFTELYNRLGVNGAGGTGSINIAPAAGAPLTIGSSGNGTSTFGNASGSGSSAFGNHNGGTGNSTFGNTGNGSNGSSAFGNGSGTSGNSSFGNAGDGSSGFGNSGSGNSTVGNSGSGSTGVGNSGNGASTFGNSGSGPSTFGNSGSGTNTYVTSEDPWQVLYSNGSKQIDSSQWLKVSADSADTSGKSLHLGASSYDLGYGNSIKQRAIYFTDSELAGGEATAFPSKRVASVRYYEQGVNKGLWLSPNFNYNDTAFADKGVGIWRYSDNGIYWTKVNLNAALDGPGTHGVQIGRGAIGFFQDIPSYSIPAQRTDAVKGLTYIVIPGIHTDDGSCYVGQISGNPYKNRDPASPETKGIPYWSLGFKGSTQLIENSPAGGIEKSERTPGTEVIVWNALGKVGINNTNPQYTLDVTGSINLTGELLVNANAGTEGQVLTSHGASSSPTWVTPAANSIGITNDDTANTNYNLTMTTASSGSVTSQVVDNGKLYYNPSEQRLYAPNLTVSMPTSGEGYLRFKDGTGVNQAMLNAYSNFGGSGRGYFEIYVWDGTNEQGNNFNFNGYGALGFDDNFGNQGDVPVSYGANAKARMARIGTGTAQLVANLPTAASAGAGARGFVTNATATTFYSIVAGGGSYGVPVFSDGTNWRIG